MWNKAMWPLVIKSFIVADVSTPRNLFTNWPVWGTMNCQQVLQLQHCTYTDYGCPLRKHLRDTVLQFADQGLDSQNY